ncbi:PEP-CTERM sorting domain-containing protein [Aquisalimonas sp. 2447]|uniref:PEP-CTERM sorting domain-containing protein n=1 Tax=Aquisalimonas sp. 2447 TaxID=2740807 RepID=UPI00143253DF|nr:PEP-CTERM sorting domain-containing protein [Aquisalimonas sp. 2447]QIT56584.1 PEP-CTERM sorting domain-containing protein [Aquisalimonas sp. 2447]
MRQIKGLSTTGMTLGLLLFSAPSLAVICGPNSENRQMTLSPEDSGDALCVASDASASNVLNNFHENDGETFDLSFPVDDTSGLGLDKIYEFSPDDETDEGFGKVTGLDKLSGKVEFKRLLFDSYSDVHVSFFFGNPDEPDNWFSYALDNLDNPNKFVAHWKAEWTKDDDFNGDLALSNVKLWGNERSVPEPLTLGLLGAGLFALGLASRRRRGTGSPA